MADKITYELIIDSGTPISVGTACSYNVTKLDNGPHTAKVIGTCQHGNKYESDEKDFTLAHPIPQISYKLNNTDAYTKNTDIWYYSDSFSWSVTNNLECTYNLYYNDELLLENTTETSFNIVEYLNEYIAQDILNITHRYNLANFAIEAISTKYGTKYRRNVYLYDYIFNNICLRFSDGIDPTNITPSSLAGLQYYSWIKLEDSEYNDWMFKVSSSKGLSYIFDDILTTDVDNNIQILSNDIKYYEINNNTSSPKTQLYASFRNCTGITKVENIDIEYCNYFSETFSNCSNVTDITIDNTSDLMSMYGTFFDCKKLVNISDIVTDNTLNIFNTFRQCTSLITAPNITSPGIKAITSCFLGDTKLETIPQYNYTGLTDASNSFNSCIALTSYGEIDLSLATDVNGLFNNCQSLPEIKIKNNDVSNVTNAAAMCCDCFEITEIPALIFSTKLNYGRKMFYECRNAGSGADVLYKSIKDFPSMVKEDTNANYNMFTLVGVDVDGGTEQLYEIPTYWGGVTPPAITATATVNDNTATISYSFNKNTFDTWTIVCEDQTKTDKTGTFTFTDLNNGEYTYTITATCKHGYETSTDVSFTVNYSPSTGTVYEDYVCAAGIIGPNEVNILAKKVDGSYTEFYGMQSYNIEHQYTESEIMTVVDNLTKSGNIITGSAYDGAIIITLNTQTKQITYTQSYESTTLTGTFNYVANATLIPTINHTFQFRFSDSSTDPTTLDMTTGTWTKVTTSNYNDWNFTCNTTNLNLLFSYKLTEDLDSHIELLDVDNTTNVTAMCGMFAACTSLYKVNTSHFDTTKVTDMSEMFIRCVNLTELDLSSFDTSSVIDMHDMFADCYELTTVNISNFNTTNVTDMTCMFAACTSLTELDLSNFNTTNVTNMACMFEGCLKLTELDLSNFDTTNVTAMNNMFDTCCDLAVLDLSNFNTIKVTDMKEMFENCSELIELDLSNFDISNLTNVSSMFKSCKNLKSGMLAFYNKASSTGKVTIYSECFTSAGINTTEGMAERTQIPTTWGGDLEVA